MIRANKGGPLGKAIEVYVRRRIRTSFRALWRRGAQLPRGPVLVYCNHTNFWDGFVAHALCESAGWNGYCVMDEENLARFPFLARLGAFSIRRGGGVSSLATVRYATKLLTEPDAAVFVFPEGEIRPFGGGALEFERGAELLARLSVATCVPVAIRYCFFEHEYPDVLLDVGQAHPPASLDAMRTRLELLARGLAECRSPEGFTQMVRGRTGVADARSGGLTA